MLMLGWRTQPALDLDALRLAARLAEAGGRDAFVPFDTAYVASQLGLTRTTAARRMGMLLHMRAVRFNPDGSRARITPAGLAMLAAVTNDLVPLMVPQRQVDHHVYG